MMGTKYVFIEKYDYIYLNYSFYPCLSGALIRIQDECLLKIASHLLNVVESNNILLEKIISINNSLLH